MPPRSFSAYHRRLGYFAAYGPPIETGPVRETDLGDVPAMTMHILGERIPRRFRNNLPRRIFPTTYWVERPMMYVGYPEDGLRRPGERAARNPDRGVEDQLRALGYVQ